MELKILDGIAIILLIIGGLNLGVVGLLDYDPIIDLSSDSLFIAHILFFLIGIAAIYIIFRFTIVLRNLSRE